MRPGALAIGAVWAASLACAGSTGPEDVEPEPLEPPAPDQLEPEPVEPEPVEPEPEIEREHLQALLVTSAREDGANLVDGDLSTSWTPKGDASGEGVLLRFEKPERYQGVTVETCGEPVELQLYANGGEVGTKTGSTVAFDLSNGDVKTVFVKIVSGADACLAEVRMQTMGGFLAIAPPRSQEARVRASSTLEPVAAYHHTYLFDGRPHFAWAEGAKGSGDGESLQITFRKDTRITAIELWNGYHRSDEHYEENARIRKLEIEAQGRREMLDVPEGMVPRKLDFDPPLSARQITLTVAASKKGTKYEDLVLSELRFWDREGPFTIHTLEPSHLEEELMEKIKKKPLGKVIDKTFRQVCGQERELKLRSDNSFVYYELEETGETTRRVVLDGAWTPVKGGIQLHARRHVAERSFSPYGGGGDVESVEVAGGRLKLSPLKSLGKDEVMKTLQTWTKGGAKDRVACLMDGRKPNPGKIKRFLEEGQVILIEGKAITDLLVHRP